MRWILFVLAVWLAFTGFVNAASVDRPDVPPDTATTIVTP